MPNGDWTNENIPDEYKEDIEAAYKSGFDAGKEEGYDTGYNIGYSEKEDEYNDSDANSYKNGYEEGYDIGVLTGEINVSERIGYDASRNIQDITGYQICYGNTIDMNELIEAIKKMANV